MKIVTLNTWGHYGPYEERWNFLLDELCQLNPDVICLQEVAEPTLTEKIKRSLSLSHHVSAYGAGLVTITRFPIFFEQVLKYGSISPNESENRSAIIVGMEINSKKVVIANTHLSWKAEDKEIRFKQSQELIETVRATAYEGFLAGDFNDASGSKAVKAIKNAGYLDLFGFLHPDKSIVTWDNRNPFIQTHSIKFPDRQIDFLFFHKTLLSTFQPKTCEIAFNRPSPNAIYPSDHYGLFAEAAL